ncbi:hypothetical protein [Chamaesiphon sp. VAR_48_metabat_403]|uniref:hypothetical protein n=1 Tax=Chamaesiphon sp. VAR_48_metabat_403 TaxID=2964700 RepID=UPI00286E74F5|nr:hypothetical protein [Chamaesiphon sp. VAR_48_metabat_403]
MMTGQQAIRSIDRLLDRSQHRKLNDLESTIVLQTWSGSTYRSIADRSTYDLDYVKQIAARLWKLLSNLLGEHISKINIRSVLERHQKSLAIKGSIDYGEFFLRSYEMPFSLLNTNTLTIGDRRISFAFISSDRPEQSLRSNEIESPADRLSQRQVRDDIQSLILQNLFEPVTSNLIVDEVFSVLKVKNLAINSVNCLIVNCYF